MTSSRTLRAVAGTVATGALLTGCGSSPAPALNATGTKAFTYDVVHRKFAGAGFANSSKSQLLSLGQGLCGALDKGHTTGQLDDGLVATKTIGATPQEDGEFLSTAVATLCPKYDSQIQVGTTKP